MGDIVARYVNRVKDPNAKRALQQILDLALAATTANAAIYDAMTASQRAVASQNKVYIDRALASVHTRFLAHTHKTCTATGHTTTRYTGKPTTVVGTSLTGTFITLATATSLIKTTATTAWGHDMIGV